MYDKMEKLIQSLQLLANDYEVQIQSLPKFVCVPDELALIFDQRCLFLDDCLSKGLITKEQKSKLENINELFNLMDQRKSLYTLESLKRDSEWEDVRKLAKEILFSLGKQVEKPNIYWLRFVKGQ